MYRYGTYPFALKVVVKMDGMDLCTIQGRKSRIISPVIGVERDGRRFHVLP